MAPVSARSLYSMSTQKRSQGGSSKKCEREQLRQEVSLSAKKNANVMMSVKPSFASGLFKFGSEKEEHEARKHFMPELEETKED